MTLTVEFSGDTGQVRPELLAELINYAFQKLDSRPSGDWEMSVLLADSNTISELHTEFFGDPSDTDVMSFPSGDLESGDGNYLGDIAISSTIAHLQAEEHQHSFEREVAFLALHGLLHLLGYDDLNPEGKQEMLTIQEGLLAAWEREQGARL